MFYYFFITMKIKIVIPAIAVQIFGIIFGIILVFVGQKKCTTKKCHQLASQMNSFIKDDAKPCDDFYQFACGKMLEGKNSDIGLLDEVDDLVFRKITEYLNELKPRIKPAAFHSAQVMHKQCTERKETKSKIIANVKHLVDDCGGFPARDGAKWEADKFKLHEALKNLREKGLKVDAFFALTFKRNPIDPSKPLMCITPPKPYIMFTPAFLATCNSDDCKKALISVYKKILVTAGVAEGEAEKEAAELLGLDMAIANLTYNKPPVLPHIYKNNIMTVEKLTTTYDFFDWNYYFNFMMNIPDKNETFPNHRSVIVSDLEYFDSLKLIIQRCSSEKLGNYIVWHNLLRFMYFPELPHTDTFCIDTYIARTMPELLAALAVKVRDDSNTKVANNILKKIGEEFRIQINEATWMDESSKTVALQKFDNLEITIGYFDIFRDNGLIDEYFNFSTSGEKDKLNVGVDFYHSWRAAWMNKVQRENYCFSNDFLPKLCQLMVYGEINLITSKMFYDPMQNQIVVADSMLHEPLFYKFWPRYMYYSRFGFFVSHDVTHILDNVGRYYDKDGNYRDWWGEKTAKTHMEKEKCFASQISEFKFFNGQDREPLPVNISLNEDIADVAGFGIAYQTYKLNQGFMPDLTLPSLDYTADQLFFISFAQTFCEAYRAFEYPTVFWGVHLPHTIRVEEVLQNSPDFSKAFSCEAGSEMNPRKKCSFLSK